MIQYRFIFSHDRDYVFKVEEGTYTSDEKGRRDIPEWMLLENFQCEHCRIARGTRLTCPAALSIEPILTALGTHLSYEPITVQVERKDIKIEAATTAQRGARSLMGLLMALSECPTMRVFRPLAHYHLPFGSSEQTTFRALGMFLIAQYLRCQEGLPHEWDLENLHGLYKDVHHTNRMMADRIRCTCERDAAVNSLILLDACGMQIETEIDLKLSKLKPAFSVFLEK